MALDVHPRITTRRLAWLVVMIVAAGAVTASEPVHAAVGALVTWGQEVIRRAPTLGRVVFVALSALSAMVAFLSTGLLAPVAIAAWGKGETLVLLWLGWLLGGVLSYGVGRFFGRSVAGVLAGAERVAAAEIFVHSRTHAWHVLLLQLALPSEVLGYVLGILRYRFVVYLGVLALSEIPFALAVVSLGESFLEGRTLTFVGLGLGMLALGAGVYALVARLVGRPAGP